MVMLCLASCSGKSGTLRTESRAVHGADIDDCLDATDNYIEAIDTLTGAATLAAAFEAVGTAVETCLTTRNRVEANQDLLALADEDRAHLLEPLVDLLDTMSLHTIVLAIGVADPTVFDAGPAGADGFRRPIAHLSETLRERWATAASEG